MRGELRSDSDDEPPPEEEVDAALAAFGLVADVPVVIDEPFHLWPEHTEAFRIWGAVQTQWRVGMAGATGLDYAGVDVLLRTLGLRAPERRERFLELQVMERAALREWASDRPKR